MNTLIEARFRKQRGDFMLDIELEIPGRGITAIFGASGSGKTTLLRAIAGLECHAGGFLRIGGETWQDADQFVPPHARALGYVFQESSLFAHLDVLQNLQFGAKRVPPGQCTVALEEVIELLGIGDLLQRSPVTLSGGERKRVAIARALAASPRILLMDEPLASMDMPRRQEILPYIKSLNRALDIPVVYVSHSPDEVAQLADYLVLLESGRVTAGGLIGTMLTRLDLSLAQGADAEALIEATVAAIDAQYHLTHMDFAGGRLSVSGQQLAIGSQVRVRVAARDVSLTLEAQVGTSILNIFPAVIDEIIPAGEAQLTVRLVAGGVPILARVTRKSADLLALRTGKQVYAQAKSVAVLA